ncbi:hypothetical protein PHMEG_00018800 [Phytophthora megakarya]|uniref:Uncharacterized protein n=1 Tax=Phytophthora megakarya TaxID=4795 RepID=A0A225VSW3_9STRA|nr:hypothetical protein PHMEG_00018800 [Phytophthora megakarya]
MKGDLEEKPSTSSCTYEEVEEKRMSGADGRQEIEEKDEDVMEPEPERDESEEAVLKPEEIFAAVLCDVKETPRGPPREVWKKTVAELFTSAHATVEIKTDLVPANKQRYPLLKEPEAAVLYQLFEEVCIAGQGSYDDWISAELSVIHELYNTNWSFLNIVRSAVSKRKWARLPATNQWSPKQRKCPDGETNTKEDSGVEGYERIMFKPGKYTADEIERFKSICEQPPVPFTGRRLRRATEDEWKIMGGISGGTIVCRQMPAFLKSVLGSQERLRLYK